MRLGITMPVFLTRPATLDMTLRAVGRIRSSLPLVRVHLWVVTTRLHVCEPAELLAQLRQACPCGVTLLHTPNLALSVAGAWNQGTEAAIADGSDRMLVMANDVLLQDGTIDALLAFSDANLWSGINTSDKPAIDAGAVTDGADFSCFMFRPADFHRCGRFDQRFQPAYFEDNDYYARVVLGGGVCRVVHAAQFYHLGSMTAKLEPDAAHHVAHWFETNRRRFAAKWGVSSPSGDADGVRARYFAHPWNDPSLPLTFCDRE